MLLTVEIEVRGGVAEATVVPKGVQVIIKDYDAPDYGSPCEVFVDDNGDQYIIESTPYTER